jgi:hypothetical protein
MPDKPRPPPEADETDEEDELLDAGQEEVFSRAEVERGQIEHSSGAGRKRPPT